MRSLWSAICRLVALCGVILVLLSGCGSGRVEVTPANSPEELVFASSEDDIISGGVLFSPPSGRSERTAAIWVHGWGVNFYHPSYVMIGRALAQRGYPFLSVNTRMHDIGNVAGYRWGKRVRGGGYWGIASQEVLDLASWIDLAEQRGFPQVVLVGHSAGWAAVRAYQAERRDPRVAGLVFASGMVYGERSAPDPELLAEATRLVEEGRGDDLIRLPNRIFPSFISAATHLDIVNTPQALYDFFGVETPNPGVSQISCPILAFFGTEGDVGGESDLELLRWSTLRQPTGPSRVDTVMIEDADHMYSGQELQVADTIAAWIGTLSGGD